MTTTSVNNTAKLRPITRTAGAIALALTTLLTPTLTYAVSAEELLELLRKKGVITQEEYDILAGKKEKPADAAQAPAKPKEETKPAEPAVAAKPKDEAKPKDDGKDVVTGRFKEGITWESADKSASIGLRGRVQADYRNFGGNDAIGADTFDLRRAYLAVEGKFYDDIEFRLRGDFANLAGPTTTVCTAVGVNTSGQPVCPTTAPVANTGGTSHLDEAWFNAGWLKKAQLRFGQFKMPFGLEEMTSDRFVDFMERSMSNALVPNKERGLMVHGAPWKGTYYGVAYSNGAGRGINDTNQIVDNKDVIARFSANVAEIAGWKDAVVHLGVAYTDGTIPVGTAPTGRTEARGVQFFQPSAFTGEDVDRSRYALETAFAWRAFKLQGEYINTNFDGRSTAGVSFDRDINAYYANLTWLVTGEHYADIYREERFVRLRPKANFKPGKSCCGAFELALRYSKFDASDFTSSNAAGTGVIPAVGTAVAKAWTLGVKWIVNPNTRFLLNYVKTDFDNAIVVTPAAPGQAVATDSEKAMMLRGQFDF